MDYLSLSGTPPVAAAAGFWNDGTKRVAKKSPADKKALIYFVYISSWLLRADFAESIVLRPY